MKLLLILASALLMACEPDSSARRQFQYCLGAAHPASAEAIKACHEATRPERATQAAQGGEHGAQ